MKNADYWIEKLALISHPEGGYFREIYRSGEIIEPSALPGRYKGPRSFCTSIYFLLKGEDISRFHRLKSDEIWHFYSGSPVTIYIIDEKGELNEVTLGSDPENDGFLQYVIPKGRWFGAELKGKKNYCLIGCTVSPGFDFSDFELAERESLKSHFPQHEEIIGKLT